MRMRKRDNLQRGDADDRVDRPGAAGDSDRGIRVGGAGVRVAGDAGDVVVFATPFDISPCMTYNTAAG
jgi:hypothetical protein